MADVPVLDATGKPTSVPQEAVASQYAAGKIRFAPGTRVSVRRPDGAEGTILAEDVPGALSEGGGSLNYDPSGAVKAGAAGFARGASLGSLDWLAIHGSKLLGGDAAGERTRQILEGLRHDHPYASTAGELAGAVAPSLIPGGAEIEAPNLARGVAEASEAAARGAEAAGAGAAARPVLGEASEVARTAEAPFGPEIAPQVADDVGGVNAAQTTTVAEQAAAHTEAAATQAGLQQAADAARAVAKSDASSGRTVGSALGSLFRHSNPNNIVGQIGAGAENYVGKLFGESGLARGAGTITRFGTEGALIGAANAMDESELGDTQLTGEALFASMEHGALFGTALGLVGTGAEKALTAAGRIADRVTEGRLGGTLGQRERALAARGPGADGARALEEGWVQPFDTAAQSYEKATAGVLRDGERIGAIAADADAASGGGVNFADARKAAHDALDRAEAEDAVAGPAGAVKQRIKDEFDKLGGWEHEPVRVETDYDGLAREEHERIAKAAGLGDRNAPAPREVTDGQVKALWIERADAEGLGTKFEKEPKKVTPSQVADYIRQNRERIENPRSTEDRTFAGAVLTNPAAAEGMVREEIRGAVKTRNARRAELRQSAADDLNAKYAQEHDQWVSQQEAHAKIEAAAGANVAAAKAKDDYNFAHNVSAVRRRNAERKISLVDARKFRATLDDLIPYNRPLDAVTNSAINLKKAARSAIEDHIEREIDKIALRTKNPELIAHYVHAKFRYGQAKDIAAMLKKGRARESSRFGREVFGHSGGIIGHALTGALYGGVHGLVAGAAVGASRKYAPTVAAWALHKLSRFAEMKALRAEVQVAMRRSVRASAAGEEVPRFASVEMPKDMPPHEMRATAAQAMAAISKVARGTDLPARLAALHPDLPILAPQSFSAMEGTARRALSWLMSSIPASIQRALAQGREIDGRDLSDVEARKWHEAAEIVSDPRVATDALARGQLTPQQAQGQKFMWQALTAQAHGSAARWAAMDRESAVKLPHSRQTQLASLAPIPVLGPPGMSLALQKSAAAMAAGAAAASPKGKVNAASGLSKLSLAGMMQTEAAGEPGRRGKGASGGL